jgi:RND superfamily putative drug exporter
MRLSTETIASACARHPWRAVGAWIAVLVAAFVCIGALLGDRLTTDGAPTNNPDSKRAEAIVERSFSPQARRETTDLVIVRSDRYSVNEPQFRDVVSNLVHEIGSTPGVANATSYMSANDRSLVSRDRHATLVPIDVPDEDDIDGVLSLVVMWFV